ncbi:hypothetical protein GCM10009087_15930 [Sphingomonas oligophenolica]|uniref:Uncharacterized protein n=1 Tax=Sphingomonas oligophenolica TaxID=301154 RepID=A0ABU9Y7X2_9SPHN
MTKPLLLIIASAALAIVPGVSNATPSAEGAPRDAAAAAQAPAPTEATKRYCAVETLTGSHIQKKTCMSRDAWIKAYGFDPAKQ